MFLFIIIFLFSYFLICINIILYKNLSFLFPLLLLILRVLIKNKKQETIEISRKRLDFFWGGQSIKNYRNSS